MVNINAQVYDLPPFVNVIIVNVDSYGKETFRRYRKMNRNSFSPVALDRILKTGDTAINIYRWQKMAEKNRGRFIKQIKLPLWRE